MPNAVALDQSVSALTGNPKKWGGEALWPRPLRCGLADTLERRPSPLVLSNLVVLGQTARAYLRRSTWENVPLSPVSQGHWNRYELFGYL